MRLLIRLLIAVALGSAFGTYLRLSGLNVSNEQFWVLLGFFSAAQLVGAIR